MWWVSPVLMLQWGLAGRYIMRMGAGPVLTAILAPTLYLWFVDVVALNNGAWFIARGTKMDELELPMALPIEEATFFLVTNVMIVFGFLTWDRTVCMAENCAEGGLHADTAQLAKRYLAAVFKSDDEISGSTTTTTTTLFFFNDSHKKKKKRKKKGRALTCGGVGWCRESGGGCEPVAAADHEGLQVVPPGLHLLPARRAPGTYQHPVPPTHRGRASNHSTSRVSCRAACCVSCRVVCARTGYYAAVLVVPRVRRPGGR